MREKKAGKKNLQTEYVRMRRHERALAEKLNPLGPAPPRLSSEARFTGGSPNVSVGQHFRR